MQEIGFFSNPYSELFAALLQLKHEIYKIVYLPRKLKSARSIASVRKSIEEKLNLVSEVKSRHNFGKIPSFERDITLIEQYTMLVVDELRGNSYNRAKLVKDYKEYFSIKNKNSTMFELLSSLASEGNITGWAKRAKQEVLLNSR